MKKIWHYSCLMILLSALLITGCGGADASSSGAPAKAVQQEKTAPAPNISEENVGKADERTESTKGVMDLSEARLKITVGDKVMTARLEDNATTRAFLEKLPTTLHMENLYGREMCYRYGKGGLSESVTRSDRYEVGDIIYWPPRGSFVILYKQNGEEFERVQMGHIDGDVNLFDGSGDMEIRFELAE